MSESEDISEDIPRRYGWRFILISVVLYAACLAMFMQFESDLLSNMVAAFFAWLVAIVPVSFVVGALLDIRRRAKQH